MVGDVVETHAAGQWVHEERRLVALALGMPLERVRIIQPPTGGAFGGREDISIQIYLGLAASKLGRPVRMQHKREESMIARHKRHPMEIEYTLGAHAAEVLVDIETGETQVVRIVAAHDVGKAINPREVEGQIEGGVAQGLGMALMEEVVLGDGRIKNASFTDYIIPTIVDVPRIDSVIVERPDLEGPHGARGIGEPPLIAAVPAILAAISDAIGVFVDETPATAQRVWKVLREKQARASGMDQG